MEIKTLVLQRDQEKRTPDFDLISGAQQILPNRQAVDIDAILGAQIPKAEALGLAGDDTMLSRHGGILEANGIGLVAADRARVSLDQKRCSPKRPRDGHQARRLRHLDCCSGTV